MSRNRKPSLRWFYIAVSVLAMIAFASPGLSKQHSFSEYSVKGLNTQAIEKSKNRSENIIRIPVKSGDTLLSILTDKGASVSDVLNSLKSANRKLVRSIRPGSEIILETNSNKTAVVRIGYKSNSSKQLKIYSGKGIAVNSRRMESHLKPVKDIESPVRNNNEIYVSNLGYIPGINHEMIFTEKEEASVFNLPIDEQNRLKKEAKARNVQINIAKKEKINRIKTVKTKQIEKKKHLALKRVKKNSSSLVDSRQNIFLEERQQYINNEDKIELSENSVLNERDSELREQIINIAEKYRGTPYKRGQASSSATDCSGLTLQVFNEMGLKLPRTSGEQFNVGVPKKKEHLTKGDLVFFSTNSPYKKVTKKSKKNPKKKIVKYIKAPRRITHVGIYVGDGKFIHAPRTGYSVKVESLESEYYKKRYIGARSVLD